TITLLRTCQATGNGQIVGERRETRRGQVSNHRSTRRRSQASGAAANAACDGSAAGRIGRCGGVDVSAQSNATRLSERARAGREDRVAGAWVGQPHLAGPSQGRGTQ